jgi:hypothetical protein
LPHSKNVEEKLQVSKFDECSSQISEELDLNLTEDEKNAVSSKIEP